MTGQRGIRTVPTHGVTADRALLAFPIVQELPGQQTQSFAHTVDNDDTIALDAAGEIAIRGTFLNSWGQIRR